MKGIKFDLTYQTKQEMDALSHFKKIGITPKLYDEIPGIHYYVFSKSDLIKLKVDQISPACADIAIPYPNGTYQGVNTIDPEGDIKVYRRGFTYISKTRLTKDRLIEGKVYINSYQRGKPDSPEIRTFTIEEFLDINYEGYKEYGLAESKNFFILTIFGKSNLVTSLLYAKFDDCNCGGGTSQRVDDLYLTRKQCEEKQAKKQAKERENDNEIYAIRGDGTRTTLDRLLSGKPDLTED